MYLNRGARSVVVHGQRRVDFFAHAFKSVMRHNLQHLHVWQGVHCRAAPVDVRTRSVPARAESREFKISAVLKHFIAAALPQKHVNAAKRPLNALHAVRHIFRVWLYNVQHFQPGVVVFFGHLLYALRNCVRPLLGNLSGSHAQATVNGINPARGISIKAIFASGQGAEANQVLVVLLDEHAGRSEQGQFTEKGVDLVIEIAPGKSREHAFGGVVQPKLGLAKGLPFLVGKAQGEPVLRLVGQAGMQPAGQHAQGLSAN